ncbi:MAG TPA: pyridoxal phosphate-dependent aminotransferase [Bacteroidia bacterium]|nr:pyridoxal phosphate-dependent aminotransferase [Bacteroidia bacterium]
MARLSRELQDQGHDVISLSLGEPDFVTPEDIRESAKKAIDEGFTHYTPISGFADLRKAISEKFKNENGLDYAVDQIVVSTGAKQSIANVVLALVNPGDEVIVPTPYWVSYSQIISLAEGKAVFVHSSVDNDYKITPEQLRNSITKKSKLFIFSSPCNPSGSVYTREELKAFADIFAEFPDVLILSDEIYEHINFTGKHESIAQFESIRDRVIIVNGVSKGYAMTGWRIGYIGAPKWVAQACDKIQGQFTSGTSSISQKAALGALKSGSAFYNMMRDTYLRRRDLMLELLHRIPGMRMNVPQGAFYVFPDVSAFFGKKSGSETIHNANDLCMYVLHDAKVSMVPGEAFGDPACVRLSYATSDENIRKAIERIKASLAKLS